jgi:L-alanine-DL-glutamate epimerase-like enolase superfamily enzyme
MPLWVESNCWTGIGQVFQAHQAAAFPGIEYTINCAHIAEDDLMREPFTVRDGFYEIPRTPGLGATLDDNALDKYRVGKGARS